MIPESWRQEYLKELLSLNIKNGFSPNAVEADTGYKVLSLGALSDNNLNINETKYVEPTKAVLKSQLQYGDFLVSRSNTPDKVGRSALFRGEINNCSYPDLMMKFRVDENLVDIKFIEIVLKSDSVRRYYKSCASGSSSTMVKITKPIVEKTPIVLPPLSEQRKIAKILSTWDKAIATTENLIATSKQQKKALMQQLLTGKKRLLNPETGRVFEGEWEEVRLNQLTKVTGGNAFKSEQFKDIGIPLIKISNIKSDYSVTIDASVFISEEKKFEKFKVINGDVLIAMSGATTGKVGCYQYENFSYLNQRVGRFNEVQGKSLKTFIFQLLKLSRVQHEILIDAVGGAQPNISNKDIERIKVKAPSIIEQQKIAQVLSTADQEIELLESKLAHFQQEKKALMQQLLTGKRRVKIDDVEAA